MTANTLQVTCIGCLWLSLTTVVHAIVFTVHNKQPSHHYFAIGSNLVPSTMTSLRNLTPLTAQAAILPDYALRFELGAAAASIARAPGHCVHGVLYKLSDADFHRLAFSEGVPIAYQWERIRVIPYVGDNECAGRHALERNQPSMAAYGLKATFGGRPDQVPSRSYLKLLQRGAKLWKLDASYQEYLNNLNSQPDGGASKLLLEFFERLNPKPPVGPTL